MKGLILATVSTDEHFEGEDKTFYFLKWVNVHQWNVIYQLNPTEIFNGLRLYKMHFIERCCIW